MNIEESKKEKQKIESAISDMISYFENKSGLKVTSIELSHRYINTDEGKFCDGITTNMTVSL